MNEDYGNEISGDLNGGLVIVMAFKNIESDIDNVDNNEVVYYISNK